MESCAGALRQQIDDKWSALSAPPEVSTVLQTLSSDEPYSTGQRFTGVNQAPNLRLTDYFAILKERFFYFLVPFGLISIAGLYVAGIQGPSYLSVGKILVETQTIAPEIVRPITSTT